MQTHKYEVVKQFVFFVEGLEPVIRGRIVRNLDPAATPFMWQISHHWKPREGAGFYHPSVTSGKSLEDVEQKLFAYADSFTNMIKEDPNY